MTGLSKKTRSAQYTPVISMADDEKNGTAVHLEVSTGDTTPNGKNGGGAAEDTGKEEGDRHRCRWGPLSPPCCQGFRRPAWALACLCWAGAVQGMVVNGFVNVVISTIERRFEISSTESGTIASCYDIAAVLCLIPISYLGGRGRKPMYLAVGMLVLGIGSFVFALPHFTTGLYEVGQAQDTVCAGANSTLCESADTQLSNYKFVFFLGQLLHGAGATPLYTLGVTYLDDNLPVRSTSLYQGIFYAFAILGPGVGYLVGGALLNMFTDLDKLDVSTLTITKDNPRWVGAWWVGFLVSGTMAVMISLPLSGFPKSMPGSEVYQAEKEKEVYKGKLQTVEEAKETPLGLKHIWTTVRMLITNPTFMFLNFAAATEGIVVSGFSTFLPKFIEFQFGLTSSVAAQYVGLVAIPAGGGATFLGGWLVKRFNMRVRTILKFCVVATIITEAFCFVFLMRCDNLPFAGISVQYQQPSTSGGKFLGSVQLNASCNAGCGCSMLEYNPVCGRDNVMYYSPCYAGCNASFAFDAKKYINCSCVNYNFTAQDVADSQYWMVEEGKCANDCPYLALLLPIFGVLMVGVFITSMPALSASLRSVAQDQRSFALGIQWIVARCLGSIPGPILFGKFIDMTCLVWQKSCEGEGACFFYDNQQMSYNLLAIGMSFNFLSIVFFALALIFYRSKEPSTDEEVTPSSHHTSMTTITQPSTPSTEYPAVNSNSPTDSTPNGKVG